MFGRSMFRRGQDFSRNFCRKLQFFKVSRSFECLIFPGLTTIRLKSRQKSRKIKMRSHAPKVKRNETMTLSDRKHFAAMIRSGAKYREVLKEHLRIFKKTIRQVFKSIDNFVKSKPTNQSVWKLLSESTYRRIKRNAESILNLESHRLKAASYRKNHDDERKTFESHCKQVILYCHRR